MFDLDNLGESVIALAASLVDQPAKLVQAHLEVSVFSRESFPAPVSFEECTSSH